jgi:hypothetical protein
MKVALVRLNWTKSVSSDVVEQKLTLQVGGSEATVERLSPEVETFGPIEIPEGSAVVASIVVNDGTFDSQATVLGFTIGDLTSPEPVTGLTYIIEDTKEVL